MDLGPITNNADLAKRVQALRAKAFSDILDDAGHQYVDLVMEGGGMLGLALVGYTWALEDVGLRFLGLGGTSAGSINALLLAAMGRPSEAKSQKILNELASKDFLDFVDGDDDARDFIDAWLGKAGNVKLAFKAAQVIDNLQERLGLNPGRAFTEWLQSLLAAEGVTSMGALSRRMNDLPRLTVRTTGATIDAAKAGARLAIVAADVSTETKVVFPDNANLYFQDPDTVDPALFVRASMSIPFFFEPLRVDKLPRDAGAAARWEAVGYEVAQEGGVPTSAVFVDGGVMSNFPIDVFHEPGVPLAPSFGAKLQFDNRRHTIEGPFDLLGAVFESARHCLDYDFIHRNPDYKHLVQFIPCKGYNWLDFGLTDKHKVGLLVEGYTAAVQFLEGFDWNAYKAVRG